METRKEVPIMLTATYLSPRVRRAPKMHLAKNTNYLIPLPPMSEDVKEEGTLVGHIPGLKYQNYNLQDPEKFPQFQTYQYMCRRVDPVTKAEVLVPQEWIEKITPSGLLNLLHIPHFG
jgi:hypothetical protein